MVDIMFFIFYISKPQTLINIISSVKLLQTSLTHELQKLRLTATNLTGERADIIDKEFDGFQNLFGSFLAADSQVMAFLRQYHMQN